MLDQTYKIGLQLFSVSEFLEKDFLGTLERISKMGYQGVELSCNPRIPQIPAKELKNILDGFGLVAINSHLPVESFRNSFEEIVEDAKTLGMNMLTIPVYPEEGRKDAAAYKKTAGELEAIGMKCLQENIKLCYHNHDTEFTKFDGMYALDLLLYNTSPKALSLEFDTAFAVIEHVDPSQFIIERADRIPIVHLKDPEKNFSKPYHYVPVGEGLLGVSSVLSACAKASIDWVVVELGRCRINRLEAVERSMINIKYLIG